MVKKMAVKALNFKMDETEILDMKQVANVYNMTLTELFRAAINEYVKKLKEDPFYKLTMNVQEASKEESAQILAEIESLSDDDLTITSVRKFNV